MCFYNIKALRNEANLSQSQVAKVLYCHREVYRRYENGISEIPVWALIMLADYYHVSTDYLLGRTRIRQLYKKE